MAGGVGLVTAPAPGVDRAGVEDAAHVGVGGGGVDPAPVLGRAHEGLLDEVLGGVAVAGEEGGGAQERHPPLAHVGVERLPVRHGPPPRPRARCLLRRGGVRKGTRRRVEPRADDLGGSQRISADGDRHDEREGGEDDEEGVAPAPGRRHPPGARRRRREPARVHRDGEVGGGAQRPDEQPEGERAEVRGDRPGPPPRDAEPTDPACSGQLAPDLAERVDPLQRRRRRDDRVGRAVAAAGRGGRRAGRGRSTGRARPTAA